MLKLFRIALCLSVAMFVLAMPAMAQDKQEETPITKWIAAENSMLDSMPKSNQEVFFVLRNKHSVIRTLWVVHRDIKNAVKACGQNNKDLKKPMQERLKDWENAVLPILSEAEKLLKTEVKEQEAFHASDYNHVIDLNDKAFKFSESKIQKTPITTQEACESLLASMDETEDNLVSILQDMLLPEEVVRERVKQAKKAEAEAEEESE